MDLSELTALQGQDLTAEQLTEGIAAVKAALPKLHTEIRQSGWRAALSKTKAEYETEDKTGKLDQALAQIETLRADLDVKDEEITTLSEGQPDLAKQKAESDLVIKGLQEKLKASQSLLETSQAEFKETLAAKDVDRFKADLTIAFKDLRLKPREVLMAAATTGNRYSLEGGTWRVYEEDGKTPILVDDETTPVKALAESYASKLPKDAFEDARQRGPEFSQVGKDGSRTMKMSDYSQKPVGEQMKLGQQAAKGELKLIDD